MNPRPALAVDRLVLEVAGLGDTDSRRLVGLVGRALARHRKLPAARGDVGHLAVRVPAIAGEPTERLADRIAAAILARAAEEMER